VLDNVVAEGTQFFLVDRESDLQRPAGQIARTAPVRIPWLSVFAATARHPPGRMEICMMSVRLPRLGLEAPTELIQRFLDL
jgi:hypothetical protein